MDLKKPPPPLLLGLLAFSSQIYIMREFNAIFQGNEITFGLLLAAWLFWGGIGSIVANRIKYSNSRLIILFNIVMFLFPAVLILIRLSRFLLGLFPGEVTGTLTIFMLSMFVSLLIGFPMGILFVFNVEQTKGQLGRTYIQESLGAAFAGGLIYFILIHHLSNWQGAAVITVGIFLLSIPSFKGKILLGFSILLIPSLTLLFLLDFTSQQLYWAPFRLLDSRDSLYGKIQVIQTGEQISLYANNQVIFSSLDSEGAEESVHFSMLQPYPAKNVLLIGGGPGGGLRELLKYSGIEIDYVEIDPVIIAMSTVYLPVEGRAALENTRVNVFNTDGRVFLQDSENKYDRILLSLPPPHSAQLNRFYTREFFQLVQERLTHEGVFSFRFPSSENYISPELQDLLATLYFTLHDVFPEVKIVPGNVNIFLASQYPLLVDIDGFINGIQKNQLNTAYFIPEILFDRLSPMRIMSLEDKVLSGRRILNRDDIPISYFFNSVLWSTQFKKIESTFLKTLERLGQVWLMDLPIVLFTALLILFLFLRFQPALYLVPLGTMGLSSIVIELVIIISFQVRFGSLYSAIALLFTGFMAGLFIGALVAESQKKTSVRSLLIAQLGLTLSILGFYILFNRPLPSWFFYFFLLILGSTGGYLFVTSNRLYLESKKNFGLGYGIDLIGSFFGVLLTASVLIPLLGLTVVIKYILFLNGLTLLFIGAGEKRLL
ncbi:fused MFS/spermidine synthase [Acidobacteriota bacterium]